MKKTRKCSEYGGTEIYTTLTGARGQSINLLPNVGSFLSFPLIEVYICGQCGHYQMFLREQDLKQVRERYDRHT
jgi:hypothetical protein